MRLTDYKVDGNGIWLSKEELEEWAEHYRTQGIKLASSQIELAMFYEGKADVLIELIKTIEEKGE